MADAEDLIYLPPKRKVVFRTRGGSDSVWNQTAIAGFASLGTSSAAWVYAQGRSFATSGALASAFSLGRGLPLTTSGSSTSAFPQLDDLGSDLLHHWEVPASGSSYITIVSGDVSQLNDRRSGAKHLTQGTAGFRPLYEATGGPNSRPCISLNGAAKRLTQAAMGIATGKRVGIYWVAKAPGDASFCVQGEILNAAAGQPGTIYQNASKFAQTGPSTLNITSPALSSAWVKRSIEYLSTGTESRIDGTLTTPNYSGSATCAAIDTVTFGHAGGAAGGKVACLIIVDNITTAKRAIVDGYLRGIYGL